MDIKKAAGREWLINSELKDKKTNISQNWKKIKGPEEAEQEKLLNWSEVTNEQKNSPYTTHGIIWEAIQPGNEITINEHLLLGESRKETEQRSIATAYARGSMIQLGEVVHQYWNECAKESDTGWILVPPLTIHGNGSDQAVNQKNAVKATLAFVPMV